MLQMLLLLGELVIGGLICVCMRLKRKREGSCLPICVVVAVVVAVRG